MKQLYFLCLLLVSSCSLSAQAQSSGSKQVSIKANDSTFLFLDSIFMDLPEIMIKGERPLVRAKEGKLVYDLPRLVEKLAVDNAYDAIKELPGVADMGNGLMLAGSGVTVIINGQISTMTAEQLNTLLKNMPVSRIEKAEVMYSAPAKYKVRGPVINLLLKTSESADPVFQGEIFTSWSQEEYESLNNRASFVYNSGKLSTDLLYSYNYGRTFYGMDKKAIHTVDNMTYPIDILSKGKSRFNDHNVRLGIDYSLAKDNVLSFVYTAQIEDASRNNTSTGSVDSNVDSESDNTLHNIRLDYLASFGLKSGVEFTYYHSPGTQVLHSTMNDERQDFMYNDGQRINKWMFYATQSHKLNNGKGINYGLNYTTAVDNSYQYYYDTATGQFMADNSMRARHREETINGFVGFNANIGSNVTIDASLAIEHYKTDVWNEWTVYPTLNVNYTLTQGHILQFAFSADKSYPSYWSTNNTISYANNYTEIHGNPLLKPSRSYSSNLTYILKNKYVATLYYNYRPDYFAQVPYQSSERLVEINKYINFNSKKEAGLQLVIPVNLKEKVNSRFVLIGNHTREKADSFWDVPFNRSAYSFMLIMDNTWNISKKPDLKFTLSGFYQNGTIQGIYDLSRSGNIDTSLKWTFAGERAQLTIKGADLFNTSLVKPDIHYSDQLVTNRFIQNTRAFTLSFSYKLGNYKEKKREAVDTSRFK